MARSPRAWGATDQIHLKCLGDQPGNRWLDGVTAESRVQLAPTTTGVFTGTYWQAVPVSGAADQITLKCLGTGVEGNRWLFGRPDDGSVGLAPQAARDRNELPETKWLVTVRYHKGPYPANPAGVPPGYRVPAKRTRN